MGLVGWFRGREGKGREGQKCTVLDVLGVILSVERDVGDTLTAARSRPNNDWGSVGNGAKSRRKARKWWLWYV